MDTIKIKHTISGSRRGVGETMLGTSRRQLGIINMKSHTSSSLVHSIVNHSHPEQFDFFLNSINAKF
jgi:hypothetical protein